MPGNFNTTSLFVPPRRPKPPRGRWWLNLGRKILRRTVMVLGSLMLFSFFMGIISVIAFQGGPEQSLPGKFVLTMTLDGDYPEYQMAEYPLNSGSPTLLSVVNAIDHAGRDDRVKGIIVNMATNSISLGHIEELRAALERFHKTKKFLYIYANQYGDPGRGLGTYYFASIFDQIWMQPIGDVSMAGISLEMPFARGTLDKLGVKPEFFQRKEYKSLFESFENKEMSPANRLAMTTLVDDLGTHLINGIAEARKWKPQAVLALMDKGMFTDKEALAAGLVTKLDEYGAMRDMVKAAVSGKKFSSDPVKAKKELDRIKDSSVFVDVDRYVAENKSDSGIPGFSGGKKRAALVYVEGTIMDGGPSRDSGFGSKVASGDNITDDLRVIANDPDVDILVLRVNSPGGSPSAAETIRRAAARFKQSGKKIVVSMGDEAASGGYWIATAGDHIFALPDTLTGSIGVAGGKVDLTGFWNKIGVNWQSVDFGKNAGMWSLNRPFSDSATERMNATMDAIYNNFIGLVAQSRHMTIEQADAVARGRVWTGHQAKEKGLVDDIGGLDAALDYAAKQVKVSDRTHLKLEIFPRPQSPFDKLEDLAGQVRAPELNGVMAPIVSRMDRLIDAARYATYEPLTVK